jgi:hypothetical protein
MYLKYRIDIYTNEQCYIIYPWIKHACHIFSHLLSTPCTHPCYFPLYIKMILRRWRGYGLHRWWVLLVKWSPGSTSCGIMVSLQETRLYSSVFLNSSVPRNITQIYSSVHKPTNVKSTNEYGPICLSVNQRIYYHVNKQIYLA